MLELLKKEEVNTGRQHNLDLLKAFAIVCMILCHSVLMLGKHLPGYESNLAYNFADDILGSYMAVAHAFMFAMGVGFLYSRKHTPGDLLRRGIHIYILAYVLNFFRYSIYILIDGVMEGTLRPEFAYSLYVQDILQFAGLAMILTAIFRKLKLDETLILAISMVMSVIGSVAAFTFIGNTVANIIIGSFITTVEGCSCFPLCNWYIFVAVGMLFGKILRRLEKEEEGIFYKRLLVCSGIIMVIYLVLTSKFGLYFLTKNNIYYATSLLEDIGLISIDFFILSLFYFLLKKVNPDNFKPLYTMSQNVNQIYITHWCILGFIDCIFCYLLGITLSYPVMYLIGVMLIIVSYWIVKIFDYLKGRLVN